MRRILVLGAGQSTPRLIRYLLERSEANDWFVTVADRDIEAARRRIGGHARGSATAFNVNDGEARAAQIGQSNVVVNMLPPNFQQTIARDCVQARSHMVSASYADISMNDIDADAKRHGVLLLNEMGLDPGIDHMSAMASIDAITRNGGRVTSFKSYGTGLPAPEFSGNPLRYAITWNPRNVVMSGEKGATYLVDGSVKMIPHQQIFQRTWSVRVDGVGALEAYPNRDSLYYAHLYGLEDVDTMIRGTLRYPGWCETWLQIVRLGVPNEWMRLPDGGRFNWRGLTEMFLPAHSGNGELESRIAQYLSISPTGRIMDNLKWLGLFEETPLPEGARTVAEAMTALLVDKLRLEPGDRDMVIVMHDVVAHYPDENIDRRVVSTMVNYGEPGGDTAMARLVGLPTAIAAELILTDELPLTGCQLPTHAAIRTRVLDALRTNGIDFQSRTEQT